MTRKLLIALGITVLLSSCTGSRTTTSSPSSTATPIVLESARGTEPFWSIEFMGTGARYNLPNPSGPAPLSLSYTFSSTASGGITHITMTPVASGATLDLTVSSGSCSDGMSDMSYPYTVRIDDGRGSRNGCGE